MGFWAFLGLMLFACVMPFTMRTRARSKFREFSERIRDNKDEWDRFVAAMGDRKDLKIPTGLIDEKTELCLITKPENKVDIIALNDRRQRFMTPRQFDKISCGFGGGNNLAYDFGFDNFSIYYRISDNSVLWIYYPSDLFISYRYRR